MIARFAPRLLPFVTALLVGLTAASLVGGSAASLEVRAASLGAGSARLICDDDLRHRYISAPADPLTIVALRIWAIDMPECRNHVLSWAVIGHGGEVLRSGTAIVTSASMPIDLVPEVSAGDIATVEAVVLGSPTHPGQGHGRGRGQGHGQDPPSPVFVVHLS